VRGVTIDPALVSANHDLPPNLVQQYLQTGQLMTIRNGDFTIYAALFIQIKKSLLVFLGIGLRQCRIQGILEKASSGLSFR
jgi:hypothetical protein